MSSSAVYEIDCWEKFREKLQESAGTPADMDI
jgi:hypothetical protein